MEELRKKIEDLEQRVTQIEINKGGVEERAIDCVMQFVETFRIQSLEEETAHFGKPCSTCMHNGTCKFNWLTIMKPLLEKSNVKFQFHHSGNKSDNSVPSK